MHATECHLDSSDDETNDYALLNLYGQQKNQSSIYQAGSQELARGFEIYF
jgi:hypothetical protein